MIEWNDIYKVVDAMVPLYVALTFGYASVRWWHMFKPEHCDAINRFNCYFIIPFFSFDFISHVNPYTMNYKFFGADVISKCAVGVVLALWANFSPKGSFSCSITAFSMCSLNNTLVVGVPLLKAMYGELGVDLVIQSSVNQFLIWFIMVLFLLEIRKARSMIGDGHEGNSQGLNSIEVLRTTTNDLEENNREELSVESMSSKPPSFLSIMKIVWLKLVRNPNTYACIAGITWALLANRWHLKMPSTIEGSVLILSKAGSGLSMFTMGLFMALHGKIIACGAGQTILGMVLRFVVGPASMAIGAVAMGLRGNVLRVALMQPDENLFYVSKTLKAALPQSIRTFVYAQEYGLHADMLRTAVIFGTIASVPLLISYFAILDILR